MFILPTTFSDNVIKTLTVVSNTLSEDDELWLCTLLDIMSKPFEGTAEEAKIRMEFLIPELAEQIENRAKENPSSARTWLVFSRTLRYTEAVIKNQEPMMKAYEKLFDKDLAFFSSMEAPS